jgi:hypothetical protein
LHLWKEHNPMIDIELLRYLPGVVAPPESAVVARARQRLLDEAVESRTPERGSLARTVGVAALISLVLAVASLGAVSYFSAKSAQASPLVFQSSGGDIVVTITNPQASATELRTAFERHGFDIGVELVAVSPSLVGTVVEHSGTPGSDVEPMGAGECVTGGGGLCKTGLRIPATFHGQANISIGRAAAPNEEYLVRGQGFGPGEVLHCSGLRGQTVALALEWLDAHHIAVAGRGDLPPAALVLDATPLRLNTVQLDVGSRVPSSPQAVAAYTLEDVGCGST